MTKPAILINVDRCVGCQTCTVVCKMENDVELGEFWTKVTQMGPYGEFPNLSMYFLPKLCQHCEEPSCVDVCPTGASYKREDGIVLVDHNKCIGCQFCVMACPYGVRHLDKRSGVVTKCTLCAHRLDAGEEPICVKSCIHDARIFGDLDDPNSEINRMIEEAGEHVYTLTDTGNHPKVHYIMKNVDWKG